MRVLKCREAHGISVDELLGEFNERREEFGITDESQIVSVTTRTPKISLPVSLGRETVESQVVLTVVFWSDPSRPIA